MHAPKCETAPVAARKNYPYNDLDLFQNSAAKTRQLQIPFNWTAIVELSVRAINAWRLNSRRGGIVSRRRPIKIHTPACFRFCVAAANTCIARRVPRPETADAISKKVQAGNWPGRAISDRWIFAVALFPALRQSSRVLTERPIGSNAFYPLLSWLSLFSNGMERTSHVRIAITKCLFFKYFWGMMGDRTPNTEHRTSATAEDSKELTANPLVYRVRIVHRPCN